MPTGRCDPRLPEASGRPPNKRRCCRARGRARSYIQRQRTDRSSCSVPSSSRVAGGSQARATTGSPCAGAWDCQFNPSIVARHAPRSWPGRITVFLTAVAVIRRPGRGMTAMRIASSLQPSKTQERVLDIRGELQNLILALASANDLKARMQAVMRERDRHRERVVTGVV